MAEKKHKPSFDFLASGLNFTFGQPVKPTFGTVDPKDKATEQVFRFSTGLNKTSSSFKTTPIKPLFAFQDWSSDPGTLMAEQMAARWSDSTRSAFQSERSPQTLPNRWAGPEDEDEVLSAYFEKLLVRGGKQFSFEELRAERYEQMGKQQPDALKTSLKPEKSWRELEWTTEQKNNLMKTISSYRPGCEEVTQARVLFVGPVGSGKSSFISSIQSVFNGRVINRAMAGSSSMSFTKKLQTFDLRGSANDPTGLLLTDVEGLGDGDMTELTLPDILSLVKGHVPEGHQFSRDHPVRPSETAGYVKTPQLKDQVHCVVFVVDASKIQTYPEGLTSTFHQLREQLRDLGVHQVGLLTKIDEICPQIDKDVSEVYKSSIIKEMMDNAGALLGMPMSYIVPVMNYSSQLDLDMKTDVLLLSAMDHILQYVQMFFLDATKPEPETEDG